MRNSDGDREELSSRVSHIERSCENVAESKSIEDGKGNELMRLDNLEITVEVFATWSIIINYQCTQWQGRQDCRDNQRRCCACEEASRFSMRSLTTTDCCENCRG